MRPEKQSILKELDGGIGGSPYVFVVDYRGMNVEQLSELRKTMRSVNARVSIVKNSLMRVITGQRGWQDGSGFLSGPCATVYGAGDPTAAAKVLLSFTRPNSGALAVRGGWLNGRLLGAGDVAAMSKLPSREVMLGMFVGTLAAPMSRLVGVFQQKLASIVYALKALEEKKAGKV